MTAYYGVSVLLSLVLGQNPTEIAEIAANLFVGIAFLANSRTNEDESDNYSFLYLQDTKYYAGGVKFFFEKLKDEGLVNPTLNKLETFFSTHPDPIARIDETNKRLTSAGFTVRDYKTTGNDIGRDTYQANIRSKLP